MDKETREGYALRETVTQEVYDQVVKDKAAFKERSEQYIMLDSEETCSDGIMLLHSGAGGLPSYREEYLNYEDGAGFLYM